MVRLLSPHQVMRPVRLIPKRSALLVLDMQEYFLDPASHAFVPSSPAILPGIKLLAIAYTRHELPVIYTKHINNLKNAGVMKIWWRDLLTSDNPLSEIAPALDPSNGYIIHKSQYDAFFSTNLEEVLRTHKVTQVVICGVMTHLCCESTARSAFVRGFEVFFPVDGTATYNQDFHLASLRNLSHGFAALVLVRDILREFEKIG